MCRSRGRAVGRLGLGRRDAARRGGQGFGRAQIAGAPRLRLGVAIRLCQGGVAIARRLGRLRLDGGGRLGWAGRRLLAGRRVEFRTRVHGPVAAAGQGADQNDEECSREGRDESMHKRMKREDMLNFSCLGRRTMAAVLLLALAACAGRESVWVRPGTPSAVRSKDYAECRSEANSLAGSALGVDQDIAASRGSDWQRTGQYDSRMQDNIGSDAAAFGDALAFCMQDKGYD